MLNIQGEMDNPRLVNYTFEVHDKATIFLATTCDKNNLSDKKYDIIFSMLGTEDLFVRHLNGHISPKYDDVGNLINVITDKLCDSKRFLKTYCNYVVICHVLGLNIDRYNNYQTDYHQQQQILDEALPYLNQAIVSINDEDEISTPMMQDTLHTRTQGARFQKYHKLYDGFNPRSGIIISWAEQLHKSVSKNVQFLVLSPKSYYNAICLI